MKLWRLLSTFNTVEGFPHCNLLKNKFCPIHRKQPVECCIELMLLKKRKNVLTGFIEKFSISDTRHFLADDKSSIRHKAWRENIKPPFTRDSLKNIERRYCFLRPIRSAGGLKDATVILVVSSSISDTC